LKGKSIIENFPGIKLDNDSENYLWVHSGRYEYLLSVVKECRKLTGKNPVNILDIGPSFFTTLLEKNFHSDSVFTLGYKHSESRGGHLPADLNLKKESFYHFDLNDSQFPERWIKIPECRIAVMAEVIEHLHTSPLFVLKFLKTCIAEGGYLIIQTPNAASLKNRISMLLGKNPFEMIRENQDNPGHFREYTMNELISLANISGFEVIKSTYKSYFNPRNSIEKVYIALTNFLPGSFRTGLTIILRKK
jgi:hypothetical protein